MKKLFADLHIHTTCSDGILSPEDVVKRASNIGLKAIAITDHDCVEAVNRALKASKNTGLEIIPGVEISSSNGDKEIHILGYFVDWQNKALTDALGRIRKNRVIRMKKMITLLRQKGVNVREEDVIKSDNVTSIGRLNLARVMAKKKKVRNIKEAFDIYIGDNKPCYVKHKRLDYAKAIKIILKAGGVPVLAHPGTKGNESDIPVYVKAGLKGIEVFHSKHPVSVEKKYGKLADEYGLIKTGGSDCHGTPVKRILMGTVTVDSDIVQRLRNEAKHKPKSRR